MEPPPGCLHSLCSVDMTVLALKYSCLVQTPCAKTPEFGEAEFWVENARLCSELFWPPLQSVFAKDTAFFSAKAQKLRIRFHRILRQYAGLLLYPQPCAKAAKGCAFCVILQSRILGIVCRLTYWNVFRLWNRQSFAEFSVS